MTPSLLVTNYKLTLRHNPQDPTINDTR